MNRILLVLLVLGPTEPVGAEDAAARMSPTANDGRAAAFGAAKYSGLEAEARMETALHPLGDAAGSAPGLYVGNAAATFDLKRFSISLIDGGAAATVPLDDDESYSLAGTSELLWLKDVPLPRGSHDIHAEMLAGDLSKPDPCHAAVRCRPPHLELDADVSAVEFKLVPATLLSSAHIELVQHRSDGGRQGLAVPRTIRSIGGLGGGEAYYSPGTLRTTPSIRYVRHLLRVGQGDAAVVELLGISQGAADMAALPAEFWLQVSSALRMANLPDQAQGVCDQLDARKQEREAVGVERLRIGILHYDTGDLAKAEGQLLSARGRLPGAGYRTGRWRTPRSCSTAISTPMPAACCRAATSTTSTPTAS